MQTEQHENLYKTQRNYQQADQIIQQCKGLTASQMDVLMKRLRKTADTKALEEITDEELDFVASLEKGDGDFMKFSGLSTGYPTLDKYLLGLKPGDVVVFGAYTNLGKSTFSMDMCFNFAQAGENVLYFALEDNEQEMTTRGLGLLKGRGLTAKDMRGWKGKFMLFPMGKKTQFFRDKFAIIPAIEALVMTRNASVICLDMLNDIVDPVNDRDADDFMVALKDMCDTLNVVVLTTARLREPKGITAKAQLRERYAPDEDAIYGRGMIKYLATKIITLAESFSHETKPQVAFSGHETHYVALSVCKNRTGGNTKRDGKVITLEFNKGQTIGLRYKELGAEELNLDV